MRRLSLAAVTLLSTAALADLTLVSETVIGGKARAVTVSVKGSKAYFEMKEADAPPRVILRDGEAKKLFMLDATKKMALVMNEPDPKQMEAQQAQLRAAMQAQLAKLPPEQRARMEATMLGNVGAAPGKEPVITWEKKKSPARKVSGFACEDYVMKRDGQVSGEGCYATWKAVGITAEDFKDTMLKAMPSSTPMMGQAFEAEAAAPGIPVWRTHVDAQGQVTSQTTVKSVSKTALSADKFEVPKDYTQKEMQAGMPPGMPR